MKPTLPHSGPPSRREFLVAGATSLVAFAWAPALVGLQAPYDLVIRGGTLFDGTGSPRTEGDLAITGGRIAAIARRIGERGTEEIDARGMAVTPGFIDIHSHGDSSFREDPRAESVVRQGVTTIVVGQDGSSSVQPFTEYFASLDQLHPSVNVASMIGLGSVRGTVVGAMDRKATADELARMIAIVEAALAQGACGASSGLEYTPGAFAPPDELIALCRPLAARHLPYATHMRNEDDHLLESVDESIAVARGARCPLQISHLKTEGPRNWGKLDQVFAHIAQARREGLDVAFDRYPYVAYQTGLSNLFPLWSRDGANDAFLARLVDPALAPRIRTETLAKVALIGGWDNVMIASVSAAEDKAAEGKRMGAYAKSLHAHPYDVTVAMLGRNHGSVGMVGFAMSEKNLERILAHPQGMVCSDGAAFAIDGPTRHGSPHPRGAGTFPRVLARYVRQRKTLTLEQAINKMTGLPASRVRLADRGRLAVGLAGDVTVFDPLHVEDKATYEQPFQYPVGIGAVVVNGAVALRDGQRAERRTGRVLKPA